MVTPTECNRGNLDTVQTNGTETGEQPKVHDCVF